MRNVQVTENGKTFNRSTKSEWCVVHEGTKVIYFGNGGITGTQKTMFVGNKGECNTYISDNNLILEESD